MQTATKSTEHANRTTTKLGIGWRPQLALAIERRTDLQFIEVTAEDFCDNCDVPRPLQDLIDRGVEVALHCTSLSLGGAKLPDDRQLDKLNKLRERLNASIISDHIAFVRSERHESGHLLPTKRTSDMIEIIVENVRYAADRLSAPFAIENIASLFEWPDAELSEAQFVATILDTADVRLLLDVSNLYANAFNHNFDPVRYLRELPLERLAYVHVAGGRYSEGLYHDTHSDPVPDAAIDLLRAARELAPVPSVMVEIDDRFPNETNLNRLLDRISEAVRI